MTEKQVSIRLAAVGGKQVREELTGIGAAGNAAFRDLDRASRMPSGGLQNLGFQIQDFAVQVGAGTSASQALAQQLPQLLSGFGLLGIALGTTAAILIPVVKALFGAGEEAQSASKAVSEFAKGLDEYEALVLTAASSTAELTAKFGEFAEDVRSFSDYLAGVALGKTFDELLSTVTALNAPLQEVRDRFAEVEIARKALESAPNAVGLKITLAGTEEGLRQAESAIGLTAEKALMLADAIDAVGRSEGVRDVAAAASEALAVMEALVPSGRELPEPLRESAFALGEMAKRAGEVATETGGAADAVADMNASLADAYGLYANLRTQAAALAQENREAAEAALAVMGFEFSPGGQALDAYGSRAPGGTGAQNDLARRNTASRAAVPARVCSPLRSVVEESPEAVQAMMLFQEQMQETDRFAEQLNKRFEDVFAGIVTGSKSGKEALADLFASLADQLARNAFQGLNLGLFGEGGLGAVLAPFFGGGRASGGPVLAGRSYMVGENGPEIVTMGGNGYVTNNTALRSAAAAPSVAITIDARGAVEGTDALIARRLQEALPSIIQRSVQASRAATARGY
jgi:uncharacterized protein YoxC